MGWLADAVQTHPAAPAVVILVPHLASHSVVPEPVTQAAPAAAITGGILKAGVRGWRLPACRFQMCCRSDQSRVLIGM